MKEWARWLYTLTSWRKTREAYNASQFGLCERCGRPGDILHHKEYLTPDNIHDAEIALGWNNLELLYHYCHNAEYFGRLDVIDDGLVFNADGEIVQAPHLWIRILWSQMTGGNFQRTHSPTCGPLLDGCLGDW